MMERVEGLGTTTASVAQLETSLRSKAAEGVPIDLQGQDSCAGGPAARTCQDAVLQQLDATLDFVLKFLEGEHAKSGLLSKLDRAKVVQQVKLTLAWKLQGRTQLEVEARIQEINAMMSEIVQRL